MMKKIYISILTTILCFPLFIWTPLANTVSQSTTTGYGSYYFTYNNDLDTFLLTLGNLGGVNMKGYCQSLIYEFNDSYSGYLDIHLLSQSIYQNATIITENCYVKGKNSSTWDYSIGFKDVTSIKVTLVLPTLTTNNAWSGNKMALTSNYNITRDLSDIPDMLEDIQTSLGTVDAQTPDMLHSLANIYNIEVASRQLLSEIEFAIRGNNSLYVLSDDMTRIINGLTDVKNAITGLNNITWNDITYTSTFSNSLTGTYNNNYYQGHKLFVKLSNPSTILYNKNPIYKIRIPIKYISNENRFFDSIDIKVYGITGNNYIPADYEILNYSTYYNFIYIYLRLFNSCYDYVIEINDPNYNIATDNNTTSVYGQYITEDYVPYWTVFNVLNQNKNAGSIIESINGVIDAVNNMSMNVNQLTVNATGITYNVNNTQVNNSVTTYNNNINQVYNIENNISADFNTYNEQFTPDFSSSLTALQDTSTLMNGIITQINGIQLFTVPILLTLAGIVLLAILG